jgi:chloride channel 7
MDLLEQLLVYVKDATTQSTINKALLTNGSQTTGWFFYAFYGTGLVFLSCVMTTYWGKGAMGSGVAEVIGYINGVNYPEAIDIKTVVTKIFGVVFAVAGGIAVGKEGPLAHIGANMGSALVYLPGLTFLQNDRMKRGYICAGASAGVSVAFGAPIGGALFMYELSRENPAWDFKLLWKTFITCAVAVFITGMFDNTLHGQTIDWSESAMKFAKSQPDVSTPSIVCIGALVIGAISGLLGAFFIFINFRINGFRGRLNTKPMGKLLEASLFAFLTATCFYWFPMRFETCLPNGTANIKTDSIFDKSENYDVTQGWCKEGLHNPLATIMWKTEGGLIKHMMDMDPHCTKT